MRRLVNFLTIALLLAGCALAVEIANASQQADSATGRLRPDQLERSGGSPSNFGLRDQITRAT